MKSNQEDIIEEYNLKLNEHFDDLNYQYIFLCSHKTKLFFGDHYLNKKILKFNTADHNMLYSE